MDLFLPTKPYYFAKDTKIEILNFFTAKENICNYVY